MVEMEILLGKPLHERLIKILGNKVLIQWEEARNTYGVDSTIIRPDRFRKAYYTGYVRGIGVKCNKIANGEFELKIGQRIFWDQWASPYRYDEEGGSYAFVREWDIYAEIPDRTVNVKTPEMPAELLDDKPMTKFYQPA